jgi:hypothetical protein
MPYCSHCGVEVTDRFCSQCGTAAPPETEVHVAPRRRRERLPWYAGGLAVLLVAVVALVVAIKPSSGSSTEASSTDTPTNDTGYDAFDCMSTGFATLKHAECFQPRLINYFCGVAPDRASGLPIGDGGTQATFYRNGTIVAQEIVTPGFNGVGVEAVYLECLGTASDLPNSVSGPIGKSVDVGAGPWAMPRSLS